MKRSFYNKIFPYGNKYILYNAASDGIIVLLPRIYKLLTETTNITTLQDIHPDLYTALLTDKFIIDDNIDEPESIISQWEKEDTSPQDYSIIINPTMDCNLHCWYCYEHHFAHSKMSEKIMNIVKKHIKNKIDEGNLRRLSLSFFGGEPLLYFEETVAPLLQDIKEMCDKKGIVLNIDFTTNGVLLTEKVIDELRKYSSVSFQITLDGDELRHNEIRKTKNNESTYKTIIKHIIQCVYTDFNILVRLNYTRRNADTFVNIIKHFRDISEEKKKNIAFSFHKVWQEDPDPGTEETINDARNWFQKEGLRINRPMIESKGRCYADKQNHIVINYNGDLYKCTAVNFLRENREGVLSNNGDLIWNQRYTQRMSVKYKNNTCKKCILFPICHGGCTQDALIYNKDGCLRNYSKEEKEKILYRRMIELLRTMKTY